MADDPRIRAAEHPVERPGHRALEALDAALAEQPRRDGHDFSAATRALCAFRDTLIARQRETGRSEVSQARLEAVNSVLSVVVGGHFPIGHVPWPHLEKARDALAELLRQPGEPD